MTFSPETIGIPEIRLSSISSRAFEIGASGGSVMGSAMTPLTLRLTR